MKKYKEAAIQTAVNAIETIGTRIILRLPIIILADVLRTFTAIFILYQQHKTARQ
jgi:hypothetical protein